MLGIYSLKFDGCDKLYVGQSIDIYSRLTAHIRNLKKGSHHNYKLQRFYNDTGILPTLDVLEETTYELLNSKEVYWIGKLNSITRGFNIAVGGNGTETSNGEHHNAKYSHEVYYSILLELSKGLEYTNQQIATKFNVHKRVVDSISCFSNHKYLKTMYPDLAAKMLSQRSLSTRHIKSPNGDIYEIKRGQGNAFAKLHGLDGNSLNSVLRGDLKSTGGWTKVKVVDIV